MPVSTDDYVAVADHIARYCWMVDAGDTDGWTALWTEDGVFTGITPEPIVGRAALRGVTDGVKARGSNTIAHKASNIFCDYVGDRDTIHAHLYNYVTLWMPEDPGKTRCIARCVMTLVRTGNGWLIKRNDAKLIEA